MRINFRMLQKIKPPEQVRGQTTLNKKSFEGEFNVPVITISKNKLSDVLSYVKRYFLKLDNFKPVQHQDDSNVQIFLNPTIEDFSSLPTEVQSELKQYSIAGENLKVKPITVGYENFTAEAILKAVLPPDKEGIASFTSVGHIVHVNLKEHLLPYKKVIGEVLYDKVPHCQTVVNKTDNIDNTYRTFQLEVLKGDPNMITTVKENNCRFKFDFSKVYWNSRLCTEHERIVKKLDTNDVLFDVFAGVGPFSIPAAKKHCYVYANDLNPESFKWLNHNAEANKVDKEYFKSFNLDGKQFIEDVIKTNLLSHLKQKQKVYIVMNLPELGVEFLPHFLGLFKEEDSLNDVEDFPTLFAYCFTKGTDHETLAKKRVSDCLGFDVSDWILEVFSVRTVSNMKEMMRISLKLDRNFLVSKGKKRKLEDLEA